MQNETKKMTSSTRMRDRRDDEATALAEQEQAHGSFVQTVAGVIMHEDNWKALAAALDEQRPKSFKLNGTMLQAYREGRLSFDNERMEVTHSEPLAFDSRPVGHRRRVARRLYRKLFPR